MKLYFTTFRFTFKLQRPPASELIETMNQEITTTNSNSVNGSTESQLKDSNDRIDGGGSTKNGSIGNGRVSQSQQQHQEFNYDSFILQDDDSDPEEFVNIVCNELAQDISNDQAEILRQEVQNVKRASLVPPSDDSSLDFVDRSTPIPAINIQNTDQDSLRRDSLNSENRDTESPLPQKRSFSFFKRRRTASENKASSLLRRRTSDTSLLDHHRRDANRFESSLNFEPNTTPQHNKKKEVRINEPAQMNGEDNEQEIINRTLLRKMSDNMTKEWDNISQHNIEMFRSDTSALEEEKEPTGQRTSHQSANKVCFGSKLSRFLLGSACCKMY